MLDGTATLIAMTEAAVRVRAAAGTFGQPLSAVRQGPGWRRPSCGCRVRGELPPARAPWSRGTRDPRGRRLSQNVDWLEKVSEEQ